MNSSPISSNPMLLAEALAAAAAPQIAAGAATKVSQDIQQARTLHARSKDAAAEAAAYAYLVWRQTQAPYAPASARDWLNQAIDQRNEEIKNHNIKINKLIQRAKAFDAGELPVEDLAMQSSNDPVKVIEIEAERQKLRDYHNLGKGGASLRKVRIAARDNSSKFTIIVKFTFGFEHVSDASMTSRYAVAIEWIDAKFATIALQNVQPIVAAIKAAGGMEMVIEEQRGNQPNKIQHDRDRLTIANAIQAHALAAIDNAPIKAQFEMLVKDAPKGVVLLLARKDGDNVNVIGQVPMEDGKLNAIVQQFDNEAMLPTKDASEFISRVLALGELIPEGKANEVYDNGVMIGHDGACARNFILMPHETSGVQLMISALNSEANVIIKATPNTDRVQLGATSQPLSMLWQSRRNLQKGLRNRQLRRLVDVTATNHGGGLAPLVWAAGNSALINASSPNGITTYNWRDISEDDKKPLDVDGYKERFALNVSAATLYAFCVDVLGDWKTNRDGKKNIKLTSLTFTTNAMTYQFDDQKVVVPCTGIVRSKIQLSFRSQDLHELVTVLCQQHTSEFVIKGDEAGLISFEWSDSLGDYVVYQPAAKDNELITKRLAPMYFEAEEQLAA